MSASEYSASPGAGDALEGRCRVLGCDRDMALERQYYQRHMICELHLKSLCLVLDGERMRFCQQCAKLHDISLFQGNQRSCRSRLKYRNRRRLQQKQLRQEQQQQQQQDTEGKEAMAAVADGPGEDAVGGGGGGDGGAGPSGAGPSSSGRARSAKGGHRSRRRACSDDVFASVAAAAEAGVKVIAAVGAEEDFGLGDDDDNGGGERGAAKHRRRKRDATARGAAQVSPTRGAAAPRHPVFSNLAPARQGPATAGTEAHAGRRRGVRVGGPGANDIADIADDVEDTAAATAAAAATGHPRDPGQLPSQGHLFPPEGRNRRLEKCQAATLPLALGAPPFLPRKAAAAMALAEAQWRLAAPPVAPPLRLDIPGSPSRRLSVVAPALDLEGNSPALLEPPYTGGADLTCGGGAATVDAGGDLGSLPFPALQLSRVVPSSTDRMLSMLEEELAREGLATGGGLFWAEHMGQRQQEAASAAAAAAAAAVPRGYANGLRLSSVHWRWQLPQQPPPPQQQQPGLQRLPPPAGTAVAPGGLRDEEEEATLRYRRQLQLDLQLQQQVLLRLAVQQEQQQQQQQQEPPQQQRQFQPQAMTGLQQQQHQQLRLLVAGGGGDLDAGPGAARWGPFEQLPVMGPLGGPFTREAPTEDPTAGSAAAWRAGRPGELQLVSQAAGGLEGPRPPAGPRPANRRPSDPREFEQLAGHGPLLRAKGDLPPQSTSPPQLWRDVQLAGCASASLHQQQQQQQSYDLARPHLPHPHQHQQQRRSLGLDASREGAHHAGAMSRTWSHDMGHLQTHGLPTEQQRQPQQQYAAQHTQHPVLRGSTGQSAAGRGSEAARHAALAQEVLRLSAVQDTQVYGRNVDGGCDGGGVGLPRFQTRPFCAQQLYQPQQLLLLQQQQSNQQPHQQQQQQRRRDGAEADWRLQQRRQQQLSQLLNAARAAPPTILGELLQMRAERGGADGAAAFGPPQPPAQARTTHDDAGAGGELGPNRDWSDWVGAAAAPADTWPQQQTRGSSMAAPSTGDTPIAGQGNTAKYGGCDVNNDG